MTPGYKILYLAASPFWGGGEQYVCDLMTHLGAAGYDCYAVVPPGGVAAEKLGRAVGPERIFRLPMRSMFDRRSAGRIAKVACDKGIDIIHANKFADAFIAVRAARLSGRGVRVVMTRHLVRPGKTGWLYRRLYERLDALVFVSDIARRAFMSRGPKVDPAKIRVIHSGISDAPQTEPKTPGRVPVIAYVGRIAPEKGLDVLIDALGIIRNEPYEVKIIGDGEQSYVDALKARAAAKGIAGKVHFEGFADDVNSTLQGASIGVAPTVVPEAFGLAVVDYMRSSLAVVTTDNGAQAEYLDDGKEALLVPPSDAGALSGALRRLLRDGVLRESLGRKAREKFLESLVYDKFLARMKALYDEIMMK